MSYEILQSNRDKRRVRVKPLSHATAGLLCEVDEIRTDQIPTLATAVVDGRCILILGAAYLAVPVEDTEDANAIGDITREAMLLHEAGHVFGSHCEREKNRDHHIWNQVCDAAIHHRSRIDLDLLDRAIDGQVITFDRLGITPAPPEQAYEELLQRQGSGRGGGCGRPSTSEIERDLGEPATGDDRQLGEAKNRAKRARVVERIIKGAEQDVAEHPEQQGLANPHMDGADNAGTHAGGGREVPPSLPGQWVEELIMRLESNRARVDRGRTYRREHRESDLAPGRGRVHGVTATIIIDASGSISQHHLSMMLGGLQATSHFDASQCFVHDTQIVGPWPAYDIDGIRSGVKRCGGGTRIRQCVAEVEAQIEPDTTRVFFSDAMSSDGLPEPTPNELWVYLGGYGDPQIMSRIELDRRGS